MSALIPPPPSVQLSSEGERSPRINFRLWQIVVTLVTLFVTVWFFTLGVFPGIAFAFLAKHILVGVVAAGLHYPPPRRDEGREEKA